MQTYTARIVVTDRTLFSKTLEAKDIPGARIEEIVNGDLFNDREAMSAYSKYVLEKSQNILSFDEFYETLVARTKALPH